MLGKFVKGCTMAISLLNQRVFTIILFVVGIAAAVLLIPGILTEGVTKREALGVIMMVFLPYLVMKAVILVLLLILDIAINFSAERTFIYRLNYEQAKARTTKLFIDRNLQYTKLDNFEFGIEKYLITVMQRYLTGTRFNYPTNIISMNPFVVARIYDLKDGRVQVKVLNEEERDAEVAGRLVIANLEALDKGGRSTDSQGRFVAGAVRGSERAGATIQLDIPQKSTGMKSEEGLLDKLKGRKKKK